MNELQNGEMVKMEVDVIVVVYFSRRFNSYIIWRILIRINIDSLRRIFLAIPLLDGISLNYQLVLS